VKIADNARVVEDRLAVGGHPPGIAFIAIGNRRDEDEVTEAEVAHDARRRPEVAGVVRFDQNDAAMFEGHVFPGLRLALAGRLASAKRKPVYSPPPAMACAICLHFFKSSLPLPRIGSSGT